MDIILNEYDERPWRAEQRIRRQVSDDFARMIAGRMASPSRRLAFSHFMLTASVSGPAIAAAASRNRSGRVFFVDTAAHADRTYDVPAGGDGIVAVPS